MVSEEDTERSSPKLVARKSRSAPVTSEATTEGIMGADDALFLVFGPRAAAEAEDLLGQTMHGRGRVPPAISFFPAAGPRILSPSDCVLIFSLDYLRIVENFSFLVTVTRTQFAELSLTFMSVQRSVAFLIVKYPPELEAWIGYSKPNTVSVSLVLRFVESRMFISIEHRPYGILFAK